jgi:cell fate regulator YaaT (PSP1 superfamily)
MDWLIHKPITLVMPEWAPLPKIGNYVLYRGDKDQNLIGIYIGYPVESSKTGTYLATLTGERLDRFERYQRKSTDLFDMFKREFKQRFPQTKPVTARSNFQWDTIYLYFYCEERLDFAEFVKYFRTKMPVKFFLYQIGARDMVRLAPQAKEWLSECGCWPMGCCGSGPLPTVEMENIAIQSLEWRDTEKLKGRCGKLKCSIVYEKALYLEELNKFPYKWQEVIVDNSTKWICIGHNIMNREVTVKSLEGEYIRADLARITYNQAQQERYYKDLLRNNSRINDNE